MKSILKTGYVVEHRNGEHSMVMMANDEMITADHSGRWGKLDDHEEDLTCGYYDDNGKYQRLEEYDIVKIYGYSPQPNYALDLRPLNRPLLWEVENVSM